MTLPHEQEADALEISKLRAEIEKLKADRARIAVEALSTQGELDAAILQVEEERRQHKATAELWLKEERDHEATLRQVGPLRKALECFLQYHNDPDSYPVREKAPWLLAEEALGVKLLCLTCEKAHTKDEGCVDKRVCSCGNERCRLFPLEGHQP